MRICSFHYALARIGVVAKFHTISSIQGKTVNIERSSGSIQKAKIGAIRLKSASTKEMPVAPMVMCYWYKVEEKNSDFDLRKILDAGVSRYSRKVVLWSKFIAMNPDITTVDIQSAYF
jgi:hypothetical protein